IKGNKAAPYINLLLTQGAHAEAYYNPPGLHPSEPNYLWLEAGTNFGVTNDQAPAINHQASTAHLTAFLNAASIPWKSYQEGIVGNVCPLVNQGLYAVRHNPMVFFDDVTGGNNPLSANCIAHQRPYTELASDLITGRVARYNYIIPNVCNDMHNSSGCATNNAVKNGDDWLKQAIPPILASNAYKNGGIIFITWDEGANGDGPLGMIVLSSYAKIGYSNTIRYTHGSMLRTLQELFGVKPLLGDAAVATDLSDLFQIYPSLLPVPPPNDNFANSIAISGLPYSNIQNNAVASLETSEQEASCEIPANITNTVWYKYTATANQQVTFSVAGSFFMKGISIWTGTTLGALTQVGCSTGINTSAKVNTSNGTAYYIRVGSSNGAGGNINIHAGLPPANDDFASATVVDTGFAPFTDAEDVIGASLQPGDPIATCGIIPTFRSVWYKYSSLGNTTLDINTTGADFDTVLSVWTGAGLGALTQVPLACNDDAGGAGVKTSALSVHTTPGVTYFIRVSSKVGAPTHLTFNLLPSSTIGAPMIRNYFTIAAPTLSWNRVTGATQYTIQVSKSSLFVGTLDYSATVPSNQFSVIVSPLTQGFYYWRVRAIRNGVASAWSVVDSFIVDLP
ncbi:MAG: alkaline phosphatase family protein, partial [Chloroflexota bacterium]